VVKQAIHNDATTRNARGQALAAPYCDRPWPGATVSAPFKWSEVRRTLDPGKFTIKTIRKRVDRLGDLWEPVLGHRPGEAAGEILM
jgi:bifunctional non-homologous end joining protein LigD